MSVANLYPEARAAASSRQTQLTKPPGSLGQMEALAIWLAERLDGTPDLAPAIAIFAADHGVTAEGVSAYPAEVTAAMVHNFAAGGAAINVLARQSTATLTVVDVGVAADLPPLPGVVSSKVARGTQNLRLQPAMSATQRDAALTAGREAARQAIAMGANLLVGGEMGIGNTTSAACLVAALTGAPVEQLVGRGTGIDDAGLARKRAVVDDALKRASATTAADWLAEVGGLEIAALAGFYLTAAEHGVPVLLDGYIATAAALVAARLEPGAQAWWLAAHRSQEPGHRLALEALGLQPLLDFGLRLGEGSGAALAIPVLRAAWALHREMATFDEAGVPR